MNKNEPLKFNEGGFLEVDELDKIEVQRKSFSDIEKLITLIEVKTLMLSNVYQEVNAQDLDITLSTERGYVCAEFCGGVYEVSLRTDIGAGHYEASVGNELVMFSRLDDAVESFFECIEEAVKEQIRKEGRDN
ncbi:hypothetical protein EIR06_18395 [Salmonella enterica]|uniref:hypothetical protein n=1 Tax=Enterobacterales TaxID=91347 RepID=UPI0011BFCB33|nr:MULTISPECIES: hypothetical protein [Enterobacterales]EAR2147311.1 hypothetical protein [Salmonella enterica]ECJ4342551.1 hypothetical protein [Salmonella enterica subsp. enterica serovar Concord]EFP5662062.1 hypothetical protein [Salmonella enterica subsp. enterica serovar Schwarzengrund]EJO8828537.1 hypothetical protein [Salmonella enterica subsp. enterica serovar Infantis]HBL8852064.1 hypothetical protein [Enterobacter hormaechei]HBQ1338007.1 hypothetical protein [Klebsiella pneumoniae]